MTLAQAPQKAYEFICWYRRMVIEGQITVSRYGIQHMPCSDYDLQEALADFLKPAECNGLASGATQLPPRSVECEHGIDPVHTCPTCD